VKTAAFTADNTGRESAHTQNREEHPMILFLILIALVALCLIHGRDYSISADEYRADASYWNERGQHNSAMTCRRLAAECNGHMMRCRLWALAFSVCAMVAFIVEAISWVR